MSDGSAGCGQQQHRVDATALLVPAPTPPRPPLSQGGVEELVPIGLGGVAGSMAQRRRERRRCWLGPAPAWPQWRGARTVGNVTRDRSTYVETTFFMRGLAQGWT